MWIDEKYKRILNILKSQSKTIYDRSSLVAIQLPLLKGAKNVVQGEGIVLGDIFHLTGGCRVRFFVL